MVKITHKQHNHPDIETMKAQMADMEVKWKRALADYQNLEKRTREQQSMMAQLACLTLIEKLLPALDHLDLAAKHLNDPGLMMVKKQFETVLEEEGVQQILAANHVFDPATMECVEQVEGEKDLVIDVVTQGYQINNRVIRPTRVTVGIGK